MKIDLPLENWVDLFGLVPRSQLAQLLPQINDRQFAKFLQFFLNKCGEVTLGSLEIESSKNGNGPEIVSKGHKLPLADVPMPENIKNFKGITLSNFDEPVIGFLQKFQDNFLLTNVNIDFFLCIPDALMAFMTKVMPLITSVNTVNICGVNGLDLLEKEEYSAQAKKMLESARVLWALCNLPEDFCLDWLHTPREDGRPRALVLHFYWHYNHSSYSFIERVIKDFLMAKEPCSFFIRVCSSADQVQALTLDNDQTQEKLVIRKEEKEEEDEDEDEDFNMCILHHPIGAKQEWIEEMSKYDDCKYRNITISVLPEIDVRWFPAHLFDDAIRGLEI